MAICTVLQGCLVPESPGVTLLLALLRIGTGLSAGGEAAGVNTYMSELGDEEREHTLGAAIGVNNLSGAPAAFILWAESLPRGAQRGRTRGKRGVLARILGLLAGESSVAAGAPAAARGPTGASTRGLRKWWKSWCDVAFRWISGPKTAENAPRTPRNAWISGRIA